MRAFFTAVGLSLTGCDADIATGIQRYNAETSRRVGSADAQTKHKGEEKPDSKHFDFHLVEERYDQGFYFVKSTKDQGFEERK